PRWPLRRGRAVGPIPRLAARRDRRRGGGHRYVCARRCLGRRQWWSAWGLRAERIQFTLVGHAWVASWPGGARVAVALLHVGRPGVGCVARLLADDAVSEVAEAGAHASRSRGEVVRRLRSCAVASGE